MILVLFQFCFLLLILEWMVELMRLEKVLSITQLLQTTLSLEYLLPAVRHMLVFSELRIIIKEILCQESGTLGPWAWAFLSATDLPDLPSNQVTSRCWRRNHQEQDKSVSEWFEQLTTVTHQIKTLPCCREEQESTFHFSYLVTSYLWTCDIFFYWQSWD